MRIAPSTYLFGLLSGLALFAGSVSAAAEDGAPALMTRLVSFPALPAGPTVTGVYRQPPGNAPRAAVVILHGSAGTDSRGPLHALDLTRVGIATLEIDMWGARGLGGGAEQRPARVHDTLVDLWGALAWLGHQPGIDSQRLGATGFSWGGAMTMLAATQKHGTPPSGIPAPAAQIAFDPVCWGYNRVPGYDFRALRPARLLILAGGRDGYDDEAGACPALVASLRDADRQRTEAHVYPTAGHGFNMLEPAVRYADPFAHRGRGGQTESVPDPAAREDARKRVVNFFTTALGTAATLASQP